MFCRTIMQNKNGTANSEQAQLIATHRLTVIQTYSLHSTQLRVHRLKKSF